MHRRRSLRADETRRGQVAAVGHRPLARAAARHGLHPRICDPRAECVAGDRPHCGHARRRRADHDEPRQRYTERPGAARAAESCRDDAAHARVGGRTGDPPEPVVFAAADHTAHRHAARQHGLRAGARPEPILQFDARTLRRGEHAARAWCDAVGGRQAVDHLVDHARLASVDRHARLKWHRDDPGHDVRPDHRRSEPSERRQIPVRHTGGGLRAHAACRFDNPGARLQALLHFVRPLFRAAGA